MGCGKGRTDGTRNWRLVTCDDCRRKRDLVAAKAKDRRVRKTLAGECLWCPKSAADGKSYCAEHVERHRVYSKLARERRQRGSARVAAT